jgi:hypothetical protein
MDAAEEEADREGDGEGRPQEEPGDARLPRFS